MTWPLPTLLPLAPRGRYDEDRSGLIELNEFRRLAEDLPSLIGGRHGQRSGHASLAMLAGLALPDEIYRNNPTTLEA